MALRGGIQVDSERRTATLTRGTGACYTNGPASVEDSGIGESGYVTIQDAMMNVFIIAGVSVDKRG